MRLAVIYTCNYIHPLNMHRQCLCAKYLRITGMCNISNANIAFAGISDGADSLFGASLQATPSV